MISDTQRWYNSTEDVVKALYARGDIDFVTRRQIRSTDSGRFIRCPTYAFLESRLSGY